MSSSSLLIKDQFKELWKQVQCNNASSGTDGTNAMNVERCIELLRSLVDHANGTTNSSSWNQTSTTTTKIKSSSNDIFSFVVDLKDCNKYVQVLDTAQKTFRHNRRDAQKAGEKLIEQEFVTALQLTKQLGRTIVRLQQEKAITNNGKKGNDDNNNNQKDDDPDGAVVNDDDGPLTVSLYLARLKKQKKEIYKDPPALPPLPIPTIENTYVSLPKRDKGTNRLRFEPSSNQKKVSSLKELFSQFQPNQTPAEILRGGAFGGTYFRPIASAVTNQSYQSKDVLKSSVRPEWIDGLDIKTTVTSTIYRENVNLYKAKCGGSLGMWESSGWISHVDPYGWFQWYCRFYQGRRSSDDERQIKRWLGVAGSKGRFKSQLCNKILACCPKGSAIHNNNISPVIRQTLFHWGLIITKDVLDDHIKSRNSK